MDLDEFENYIEKNIDNQPSIKGEAGVIYMLQDMDENHSKKKKSKVTMVYSLQTRPD